MGPASPWIAAALLLAGADAGSQEPTHPRPAFGKVEVCALCHSASPRASALRDAAGRSVAPVDLWRTSPMAAAARDPLWRAVLAAELAAFPARRAEIEAKCLACHAPVIAAGASGRLDAGASLERLAEPDEKAVLARRGVSCTICHQILPAGLGTPASWSGGLVLGTTRELYGPHASPFAGPMRMHSGFTPAEGAHVLDSALCATCHTLFTHPLRAGGGAADGLFGEQTPYVEWRSSAFQDEREPAGPLAASCQDCHVPTDDEDGAPIETRIARNPGGRDFPPVRPRTPIGRHLLAGGNTLLLSLLRAHPEELGVEGVPGEAWDAALAATRAQLEQHAARLRVSQLARDGERLRFAVEVLNLAGHKLPTGHPSRRAWLALRVTSADGAVLLASGEHDARGRILDGDGAVAPQERVGGPTWPHVQRIAGPGDVQVWEGVMVDTGGRPTWRLLAAAAWGKDDRLLPIGFAPSEDDAQHVRPRGLGDDPDFAAGYDRVEVDVPAPAARGPFTIEARLCYQPIGARWLAELLAVETAEGRALAGLLEGADLAPVVLARARVATDA